LSSKRSDLAALTIGVTGIISMLLILVGPLQMISFVQADNDDDIDSDLGVSESDLDKLGDRIDGLETPNRARITFGNVITCGLAVPCIGTDNDDIIYSGARAQAFALEGNDIVYGGGLSDQVYGGDDDDLLIAGAGRSLVDGGPDDDTLLAGLGNDLLTGGRGNDKIFAGAGSTVMYGGRGANHFDCPLSALGLAKTVVMDYNPSNGDTISGPCMVVNTIGNGDTSGIPSVNLPDTGESGGSTSTEIIPGTGIGSQPLG
jgi:Ca2+-binding RTX toxin-like protein